MKTFFASSTASGFELEAAAPGSTLPEPAAPGSSLSEPAAPRSTLPESE